MFDRYEKDILQMLQKDGRASTQDLSEAVGLSPSPCWRRVRKLEEDGVICGYAAILDPKKLDLAAFAYVHVSLVDHQEETLQTFSDFVSRSDQVIECATITGDADYVLKVVARDPEGLENFIMESMLRLGVVRNTSTNFVLRQTKRSTALPIDL